MQTSSTIHELALALSKCQAQMQNAKMTSNNPFFKSKYADLAEIWDTIRKPLTDNELSIIQLPSTTPDNSVIVTTRLLHSSGEWIEESLLLKPAKADPQGIGSAITYARRYGLAAIVGVSAEQDDDGNACSKVGSKETDKQPDELPSDWDKYTEAQKTLYNKRFGNNLK